MFRLGRLHINTAGKLEQIQMIANFMVKRIENKFRKCLIQTKTETF